VTRTLISNVRYAVRRLRMSPVFTAAAVLTLALGIGGTTAIFTLVDSVMLRSLPVSDPARLYRIGDGDDCCVEGGTQDTWGMFSYPLYQRLREAAPEFEEMAAFQAGGGRLSMRRAKVEEAARPLRAEYVTGNYFSTFGVSSFAGRVFAPADDVPGAAPVVVLSHHAWESSFGSDPSIVGSAFFIEAQPFTVIGIAPPGFFGDTLRGDPPDLWIPMQQEPIISPSGSLLHQSPSAWLRVIGRLRRGATTAGVAPRLTGVLREWIQKESGYPSNWMPDVIRVLPRQVIDIVPAGGGVGEMKDNYSRSLQILFAVCGLVLLIACANVANLLLARGVISGAARSNIRRAVGDRSWVPDFRATLRRIQLGSTRIDCRRWHAGDLRIFRRPHPGSARWFHFSHGRAES
jgi:predicted permease